MEQTVKTKYGSLCGEKKQGYIQFLGVPYAQPPVGELRFRKPQPMKPWTGIRQARKYGEYSFQPGKGDTSCKYVRASEDCLHLNIFTPACDKRKRPVVVWIHGGAYLTGSNSTDTKMGGLMCIRNDIVVVAIQYRLGALGCVDFSSLSGANGRFDTNCGTWDQVAAVNWVIENIADFGGDPECICLMGESAGACSVLTLMTTPYLRGKIKRAVMDSPAPHLIHTRENAYRAALDVTKHLGLSEEEAWRLADMDAQTLTDAVEQSEYGYVKQYPYLIPTAPVVDKDLIPELPYDAVMHGAADGIDVLIGTTRDEGTMFAAGSDHDIFPANAAQLDKFFKDHPAIPRDRILNLYKDYPEKKIYQEIGKEIFFHLPSVELANRLAKSSRVFVHHFDYAFPVLTLLGAGAVHCTNSALTAGVEPTGNLRLFSAFSGRKGRLIRSLVHGYWCNFIAKGDTNGEGLPFWPEYGIKKNTFFINVSCHAEEAPFARVAQAYGKIRPYGN